MVCKEGGEPYMKKGHWSPDEDERLYRWITNCGVGTWSSVAELAGMVVCIFV
jgi:myb proto-oncogene protein